MYHDDARDNPGVLLTSLLLGSAALAALIYYRSTSTKPISEVKSSAAALAADAVAQLESAAQQAEAAATQLESEAAASTPAPEPLSVDPGTPAGISSASDQVVTQSGEVYAPTDTTSVVEPAASTPAEKNKLFARAEKQISKQLLLQFKGRPGFEKLKKAKVKVFSVQKAKKTTTYLSLDMGPVTAERGQDLIVDAEATTVPAMPRGTMRGFFLVKKDGSIVLLGPELMVSKQESVEPKRKKAKANPESGFITDLLPLAVPAGVFFAVDKVYEHKNFWIPAGAAVASYFAVTMMKEEPEEEITIAVSNRGRRKHRRR